MLQKWVWEIRRHNLVFKKLPIQELCLMLLPKKKSWSCTFLPALRFRASQSQDNIHYVQRLLQPLKKIYEITVAQNYCDERTDGRQHGVSLRSQWKQSVLANNMCTNKSGQSPRGYFHHWWVNIGQGLRLAEASSDWMVPTLQNVFQKTFHAAPCSWETCPPGSLTLSRSL